MSARLVELKPWLAVENNLTRPRGRRCGGARAESAGSKDASACEKGGRWGPEGNSRLSVCHGRHCCTDAVLLSR